MTKDDLLYLQEMVWLRVTFSELHEKVIAETQTTHESWNVAGKNMNSTWDVSFFIRHAANINENRFTILEHFSTRDGKAHFITVPV